MDSKIEYSNCKCLRSKEKLEKIKRSKIYWQQLILSKNLI